MEMTSEDVDSEIQIMKGTIDTSMLFSTFLW